LDVLGGRAREDEGAFALHAFVRRRGGGCQTGGDQLGVGSGDVVHFEAEVVQAGAIFREPRVKRMVGAERLDELEVGVPEVEVREANGAVVGDLGAHDGEAELVAPDFQGFVGGRDYDSEVIEAVVLHAGAGRIYFAPGV
jgi:hypothetical protein